MPIALSAFLPKKRSGISIDDYLIMPKRDFGHCQFDSAQLNFFYSRFYIVNRSFNIQFVNCLPHLAYTGKVTHLHTVYTEYNFLTSENAGLCCAIMYMC